MSISSTDRQRNTAYRNPLFHRGEYCDEHGRNYFFDNAKFILIFLVVLAHAVSPLMTYFPGVKLLWRVINTMHMPCLIFISGFFAKKYIRNGVINVQRPVTYAVLYLAAQLSVGAFEDHVLKNTVAPGIFNARSSLWFLQCLVWWYLFLPLFERFQPKYVMAGVIIMGLFAGYDMKIGNFLAFSRMLVHMPFFMAGYYIDMNTIEKLFTHRAKLLAIPALVLPVVILALFQNKNINDIITCNMNFWDYAAKVELTLSPLLWWTMRLLFYISAALLCFGFLALVPRSWNIFTRLGSRTLQVYILHRFLYLAEQKYEWWKPFNSPGGVAAMIGIAAAATVILSLKVFSYPFTWLQSIKVKPLLKDDKLPAPTNR